MKSHKNLYRWIGALAVASLAAPLAAGAAPSSSPDGFGLLVMAHGGSKEWNQAVLDAVKPLEGQYPVSVAFGMADACSLQESVRTLEARGVKKVGVVRLFISGESWYDTTEKIFGLRDGAPAAKASDCGGGHEHHGAAHHSMAVFRIDSGLSFALSKEGLSEAPEMGAILAERAASLARQPEKENVLVLAHGPAEDEENKRWLANMEARSAEIRRLYPFHHVEVMTLREDWPEKRKASEQKIRDFIAQSSEEGRRTVVIPFRLHGFGPYAEILQGLDYDADQRGLLPHVNVTRWISRQADELRAGFPSQS